jgi:alpha-amylase/alpha-mannosidase (GH57 family)
MSSEQKPVDQSDHPMQVVFCWHMHQPEYRDLRNGEFQFPWTYLHALKDYVDMAAHLEQQGEARAVVNFAPVLLEQIADYVTQLDGFINDGGAIRDPLLAALAEPVLPSEQEQRMSLLRKCLRVNQKRVIDRFPGYSRLAKMARALDRHPDVAMYASQQFFVDLVMWYHLGWIAETTRRNKPLVQQLQDKQFGYTVHDRRELLQLIYDEMRSILPRYRRLHESGRVELAMSPYAHPMLPLLLDMESARDALPNSDLPLVRHYPGGEERANAHLQRGLETFEEVFGMRPVGCWPSEGGVSQDTLRLLAEHGFAWCASGESVVRNSIEHGGEHHTHVDGHPCRHRVYRFGEQPVDCFFRDDGLSDLIGFTYAEWHADDAVNNLVHHLEQVANSCPDRRNCAVSIILDGENAWEYYPENAYHFLSNMYRAVAEHPALQMTTFRDFQQRREQPQRVNLPRVVAGSWVYGTFSTWVGDTDKNRGWDILAEAKRHYDEVVASGRLDEATLAKAEQQLSACEGSDWFWWFGDYNPAAAVNDFERLFRHHLSNLYQLLGVEPPVYLAQSFSQGSGAPSRGGVMRPGQAS